MRLFSILASIADAIRALVKPREQSNELSARGSNPLLPACAAAAGSISLAGSRFRDSPFNHAAEF
jgi:hypothetical protein